MFAKHELRQYVGGEKVWCGKYANSCNLPHWHYDCEFLFVEKGEIEIFFKQKKYIVKAGNAFFIDSTEIHSMEARCETILILFIFTSNLMKKIIGNITFKSPVIKNDYQIPEIYQSIRDELLSKKQFYETKVNNLMINLMLNIYRNEETETNKSADDESSFFQKVMGEIENKYAFYSFKEAAKDMNMSEAYFSRLFHRISGITFSKYLNIIKVEHAVEMLKQDAKCSITDVAMKCGFGTIRSFNRTFLTLTGYSPKSLPKDYSTDSRLSFGSSFDPTLTGTRLIEGI